MADISLYNKWRPTRFDQFIGQAVTVKILKNSVTNNRVRQAYLFHGFHGSGKTSLARIFASAINCQHSNPQARPCGQCPACISKNQDIVEIDAATNTSIEDVRLLRDRIQYLPEVGQKRIYIIDEIHRFSGSAFDALLKMIEEPPRHIIFMLATTEIDKIPDTIQSRCVLIPFYPIDTDEIESHLANIALAENILIDSKALHIIATEAKGSVRDGIKLLDQLAVDPSATIRVGDVQKFTGVIHRDLIKKIIISIIEGRMDGIVDNIRTAVEQGAISNKLAQQIAEAAHAKLIYSINNNDQYQYKILSDIALRFSNLVRNSQRSVESIDIEIEAIAIAMTIDRTVSLGLINYYWNNGDIESGLAQYTRFANNIMVNCFPIEYKNNILTVKFSNQELANSMSANDKKTVFENVVSSVIGTNIQIYIVN